MSGVLNITIPSSGLSLGETRDPIRNNFVNYFNVMSQDHVQPNLTGQGKHNKSTYIDQGTNIPTALAGPPGEIVVYATSHGVTVPELFFRRQNGQIVELSIVKAWAVWNGASIDQQFNVSGITNATTGNYVVSFSTNLNTTNYAVLVSNTMNSNFTVGSIIGVDYSTRANSGFNINAKALTTGGANVAFSFMVLSLG